jgi:chromosome segregation ATPase
MKARLLPILNAAGCIALTVLVIVQWRNEHRSLLVNQDLRKQISAAQTRAVEDAKHRAALERDIALLKESIEATQLAAEKSAADAEKFATALQEQEKANQALSAEIAVAREQLAAWEQAVAQRDQRIETLDAELARTRQRLEEAIARLREAGAR